MTKQELKNSIAQTVKNDPTPKLRGDVLRAKLNEIIEACYPSTPNINSIMRFPKDASLTTDHIGLLAMQQVTVLNNPPQSAADFEVKAVLCNTTPSTTDQNVKYKIELFGLFDLSNEQINDNSWSELLYFYFTGNNGSYGANYLFKSYLFNPNNGNPYGTADADGILHFADNTEKENALNWLANNNGGFIDNGHNTFVMESPFTYNATTGGFECILQANISFDQKEWADRNNPPYHYTITELVPQTTYCPELVQNTVLGTIVGIDGDEVLIDTAMVQTLKMASTADGAMGILPKTENFSNGMLVPWRNGTVIEYFGWTQIANIPGDANAYALASGTIFSALNSAAPEGEVIARFINMPIL